MTHLPDSILLEQLSTIAEGLGETFAPFCEVVIHDLKKPGALDSGDLQQFVWAGSRTVNH